MDDRVLKRYEGDSEIYKAPRGIEIIADNAFYDRSSLRKIMLSDSITSIGDYAFKLCYRLKEIKLPESIEHFGTGVFQQCDRLERVNLPRGIKVIDAGMFVSCNSLVELGIPETVEVIEPGALAHCVNLDAIYTTANVFELVPDNKKLITAITFIEQIYYMNGPMRAEYISSGSVVFDYIKANARLVMESLLSRKQDYLLGEMLGCIDFGSEGLGVILDVAMDARRDDLSHLVLESRIESKTKENSIFDINPFA